MTFYHLNLICIKVFITFLDGYFIYCFFALLVTNLGGPTGTISKLQTSETQLCCNRYLFSGEGNMATRSVSKI